MKKYFSLIISWIVFLALGLLMFVSVYYISRDPYAPIKDAEIPKQTKEFFADILGKFGFNIRFVNLLDDKSWSNENDYGIDSTSGLIKTEDENFVIYYDTTNASENEKAGVVLKFANANINPLKDMFGKYYFAKDVKGRKLPIYLASSDEKFHDIYGELSTMETETNRMDGVCINTIAGNGAILTDGIILKDFGPNGGKESLRLNLKHEMAHFVHLNSVQWLSTHPLVWEIEGFAMYFENDKDYFKTINKDISGAADNISLSQDVENYIDAYWVGYTVMLFLSEKYSSDKTLEYIHSSYQLPAGKNFEKTIGQSIGTFEKKWVGYVERNY